MQTQKNYTNNYAANLSIQNKEVIDAYEKMNAGEITVQDYMMVLLNKLEPYIKSRIAAKHRTVGAEFNDLVSAGQEAVIREALKYNPYQSMPTSFFTVYIDSAMKDEVRGPSITTHYVSMIRMLDKIAKENGYENCIDPRLSFQTLCILASSIINKEKKVSTKTIREALKIKRCEVVSLDTQVGDFVESPFDTPEQLLLKKEKTSHLNKMLESLSPLDLYILQSTICRETSSIRGVVADLNTPEIQSRFGLHKKIDASFVNKRQKLALRKLRFMDTNNYLELTDSSDDMFLDVYEQATEDEIASAVEADCIFDTDDLDFE